MPTEPPVSHGVTVTPGPARITIVPLPENHEFYATIGRVAAQWARLEHVLDLIIWDFVGIEPRLESCVTGQLNSHFQRLSAIEALATAKGFSPSVIKDKVTTLVGPIGQLAKRRNRFVHDAWYIIEGRSKIFQFKSITPEQSSFGFQPIGEDYAKQTLAKICDKVDKVIELREYFLSEQKSLP